MPKRSVDWKESLSQELLESVENRRQYFMGLLEESFSWREALREIVKVIGLKEYAELSGFKSPNLLNQLSDEKDIRVSTLEKMISPLGVTLTFWQNDEAS